MERIFRSDFWKRKTALPVSLKSHRSTKFQPETLLSIVFFCHFYLDSVTEPLCSSTKGQGHKKVLTVDLKKSLALWRSSEFWNLFPLPIIAHYKSQAMDTGFNSCRKGNDNWHKRAGFSIQIVGVWEDSHSFTSLHKTPQSLFVEMQEPIMELELYGHATYI